jgi:single-stranded-DNA-specific exonuclease
MQRLIRRRDVPGTVLAADMHPVLRRVYAARGVTCTDDLDLSLGRLLPVGTLGGVDAAAELLAAHRHDGRILIVGDFDADGATSTALMVRALRALAFAHVDFLVPNRFRFGYGLTPEIVALAARRRPSLIVTVDNGVSSIEGVEAARGLGIPVLVTDHHLPGPSLPRAAAIVNPNLADSRFGSRSLAGVGVAFYVMAALARRLGCTGFKPSELLDLVALGTVADVVPLDRNNRVLVEQGLQRIRAGRCVPGIRALLDAGGRRIARASAADLGFAVAPRLNAAGRITDMSVGIACLLADDAQHAAVLARQLSALNEERREIERRMQAGAVDIAANLRFAADGAESMGLCLFDESWHQGVVGLVAGRIKDRLHRPVVAFARAEDGSLRGSGGARPRRARQRRGPPSGTHHEIRRPRNGRRPESALRSSRRLPGGFCGRDRRACRCGSDARRDPHRRGALRRRTVARHRAGPACRRPVGSGISRSALRRRVLGERRPRPRRQASETRPANGGRCRAGRDRLRPCRVRQPARSRRNARATGLPAGGQRVRRSRAAAAQLRARAAGLRRCAKIRGWKSIKSDGSSKNSRIAPIP